MPARRTPRACFTSAIEARYVTDYYIYLDLERRDRQSTLVGYEVREYLLEKFERKCAYSGAEQVPLQVEHIRPRSRGWTATPPAAEDAT